MTMNIFKKFFHYSVSENFNYLLNNYLFNDQALMYESLVLLKQICIRIIN